VHDAAVEIKQIRGGNLLLLDEVVNQLYRFGMAIVRIPA